VAEKEKVQVTKANVTEKKAPAAKAEKPVDKAPQEAKAVKAVKPVQEKPEKAAKPAAEKAEKPAAKENSTEKAAPKAEKPAPKAEKAAPKAEKPAEKKTEGKYVHTPLDLERYRIKKLYAEKAVPALMKKFGYKNVNQVPKLEKIVLNMGLGDCKDNPKSFQLAVEEMKLISGQKPVITSAKKSVANFKVRKGMNIGAKVTLRGERMYDFADKFLNIVLPRVRDFRGVYVKSFDGRGNFAIGVKEQLIFPEITYDQVEKVRGLDVCFVTTAKTDEEARELLMLIGMPFSR
jgi:large subunit ribosomal protein L5